MEGIFAAVTILIKKETDNLEGILFASNSSNGSGVHDFIAADPTNARILISSTIAFIAGIFQVRFKKFIRLTTYFLHF